MFIYSLSAKPPSVFFYKYVPTVQNLTHGKKKFFFFFFFPFVVLIFLMGRHCHSESPHQSRTFFPARSVRMTLPAVLPTAALPTNHSRFEDPGSGRDGGREVWKILHLTFGRGPKRTKPQRIAARRSQVGAPPTPSPASLPLDLLIRLLTGVVASRKRCACVCVCVSG